jgi:uncharacterized protein YfbU (UPF0304 family)
MVPEAFPRDNTNDDGAPTLAQLAASLGERLVALCERYRLLLQLNAELLAALKAIVEHGYSVSTDAQARAAIENAER